MVACIKVCLLKSRWFSYLHLNRLTVDKLYRRHQGVKDDGRLATRVEEDGVDFSFNCKSGVQAAVHVDNIVHLSTVYHQGLISFLMLLQLQIIISFYLMQTINNCFFFYLSNDIDFFKTKWKFDQINMDLNYNLA